MPRLPGYHSLFTTHPSRQSTPTHTGSQHSRPPTVSADSLKHCVKQQGSPAVLSQYSQRVAFSKESALAFSPPAWSPLRYFPPTTQMAILLRSQNSKRNWTGVELLHTTAVPSPTHQYFPWESGQTTHTKWSLTYTRTQHDNVYGFKWKADLKKTPKSLKYYRQRRDERQHWFLLP